MTKKYIINKVNNKTLEKLNKKIIKKIITTKNNKYIVYFLNGNQKNFSSLNETYEYFKYSYKLEKNNIISKNNKIIFKPFKKEINLNIYIEILDYIKNMLMNIIYSEQSEYIKELNIEEDLYKIKNLILKTNKTILNEKIRRLYEKELYGKGNFEKYINIINNIIKNMN